MNLQSTCRFLLPIVVSAATVLSASADDLRNIKRGEPVPPCSLAAIDGTTIDSSQFKNSVVVYVCLSAEQRRSEMAAMESQGVIQNLGNEPVRLIHVTADITQKAYFEKFRQDRGITTPLVLDAQRTFYSKLGLIVFPTTVIVNKDGKLDSVISLHNSDYRQALDAHIKHALGKLTDAQLDEQLAARPTEDASPKNAASSHRALARLMREKGQLDAARSELTKGLELDKDNREIMLDLADLNLATDDLEGADAMVQKVLAAQADHRRAKLLKGEILLRKGKLDESQAVLEEALTLNPNPELVHYYLGRVMEAKGDKDQALKHYHEALARFVKETHAAAPAAKDAR